MRILHTSDWHIGRQFHQVSLIEDQRHVLDQIIEIITEYKIDVILIAGDIYDRSIPAADAVQLLDDVIDVISHTLQIPLILISGNHDSAQRLTFGARQLVKSDVYLLGQLSKEPQFVTLNDEFGEVRFYGIPYADPANVRNILENDVRTHEEALSALINQIKQTKPSKSSKERRVVLSHCFIEGGEASESERPLSVGGADSVPYELFKAFEYTALGHLHGAQFKGQENIRYSGSILKYSFSEVSHKKSVTIVDIAANGECHIDKVALTPLRDMRIIEGYLEDIILNAKNDPSPKDYLLIRLLDTHALFEPMAKLREVYPNVLQLEKPNLAMGGERQTLKRENLKKGELPMFLDFYQQMTGDELDEAAEKVVVSVLDKIHQGVQN